MLFWISVLITLCLAGLALLVVYLWATQETNIYRPRRYTGQEMEIMNRHTEKLVYGTSEGTQASWYLPPRNTGAGCPERVWLIFGGSGCLGGDLLDFAMNYPDEKTAFCLVDYPGYGLCEGSPNEKTLDEAAVAAWHALAEKLGEREEDLLPRTGIFGISLGGAICLYLARAIEAPRVMLVCTFTSLHDIAAHRYSRWLLRLLRHRFDNDERVKELAARPNPPGIVLMHGTDDRDIPLHMSETLARHGGPTARLVRVRGAGHTNIVGDYRDAVYKEMMRELGTDAP